MKVSREEQDITLNSGVEEKTREIVSLIKEEKLVREDNQKSSVELLRETLARVKIQIQNEREERVMSQESILQVLEAQCKSFNKKGNY